MYYVLLAGGGGGGGGGIYFFKLYKVVSEAILDHFRRFVNLSLSYTCTYAILCAPSECSPIHVCTFMCCIYMFTGPAQAWC